MYPCMLMCRIAFHTAKAATYIFHTVLHLELAALRRRCALQVRHRAGCRAAVPRRKTL